MFVNMPQRICIVSIWMFVSGGDSLTAMYCYCELVSLPQLGDVLLWACDLMFRTLCMIFMCWFVYCFRFMWWWYEDIWELKLIILNQVTTVYRLNCAVFVLHFLKIMNCWFNDFVCEDCVFDQRLKSIFNYFCNFLR